MISVLISQNKSSYLSAGHPPRNHRFPINSVNTPIISNFVLSETEKEKSTFWVENTCHIKNDTGGSNFLSNIFYKSYLKHLFIVYFSGNKRFIKTQVILVKMLQIFMNYYSFQLFDSQWRLPLLLLIQKYIFIFK